MPRNPIVKTVVEVVCKNCGYNWETDPLRWRNMQFIERKGNRVKILRCPACGTAIGLTKDEVLRILRSRGKNECPHGQ